jgi:hypothetical protein
MHKDFILQIISSSESGLTFTQIINMLNFLGVEDRHRDPQSFRSGLTWFLDSLIKDHFITKSKIKGENVYAILPAGLEYLMNEVSIEMTKEILARCS